MKFPSKHAIIVVLLWAFAPLAWYLMCRDKRYHSWFPKLLWINGIIFGVIFITQSFMAIPRLNAVYDALRIHVPTYVHPGVIVLVILFLAAQIWAGHVLEGKLQKKKGVAYKSLADRLVAPIIVIFAIDGALGIITGLLTTLTPAALLQPTVIHFFPQLKPAAIVEVIPQKPVDQNHFPTPPVMTPSTTPTPKPLTFAQMNTQYGPCTYLPTFMYHHIEDLTEAKKLGRAGLAVSPANFDQQMQYLTSHGYQTPEVTQLISFFSDNTPIAKKSVLLTFDDGYDDFYTIAYPILKKYNLRSILFLPTGLVGNPGYLSWSQIQEMNSSGMVLFANHTWSHKSMNASKTEVDMEIQTADRELSDHGLGNPKIFAYPYGTVSTEAQKELQTLQYRVAFTTHNGSTLCKKQALTLPRVRIGNAPLASYGF